MASRKHVYTGKIQNSGTSLRVVPDNIKAVNAALEEWGAETPVKITLERMYRKATHKQFEWLYGVVYEEIRLYMIDELQYAASLTVDDVDMWFKKKFSFEKKYDPIDKEWVTIYIDKKDFNTKQFTDFVNNVILYAAETWGLQISVPEDLQQLFNLQ